MEKAERFASRMIQRLCPAVDLEKALINYKQYDPHDGLLLIGIGEIKKIYIFQHVDFWKNTLKFPVAKEQISSFEIICVYIYFPRFSREILLISTGTLSKLEICALTLGNFTIFFQKQTWLFFRLKIVLS